MLVADRAHCSPWELDDVPVYWIDRIRLAVRAENGAAAELQRKEARKAKLANMKRGG